MGLKVVDLVLDARGCRLLPSRGPRRVGSARRCSWRYTDSCVAVQMDRRGSGRCECGGRFPRLRAAHCRVALAVIVEFGYDPLAVALAELRVTRSRSIRGVRLG